MKTWSGLPDRRRSAAIAMLLVALLIVPSVIEAKRMVPMGTGASGQYYFVLGAAIAKILNQHGHDLNVVPQSVQGSAQTTKLVSSGELQLGLAVVDALHFGARGEREFDRAYADFRLVIPLPYVTMVLVTLEEGSVKSMTDIKGRSVAANSKTTEAMNSALFKEYGLGVDDYKRRILNYTEQASALKDRSLDAAVMPAWPRSATILELANSRPIRLINVDPEREKTFNAKYPYWTMATVPANTYPGQDNVVTGPGFFGYLIANKAADEKVIYDVAKAVLENSEAIGKIHPSGKDLTLDLVKIYIEKKVMPAAFHPGAARYLAERGIRVP
jgi:TRAP transporter TAXI family solute receptor